MQASCGLAFTSRPAVRPTNLNRRAWYGVHQLPSKSSCQLRSSTQETDPKPSDTTPRSDIEDAASDEVKKLLALRQQQKQAVPTPSGNILQASLQEAQLITWPRPSKALGDTVTVLIIVVVSGALLFGVDLSLTQLSQWWYSR